jgi:hypothetical protein
MREAVLALTEIADRLVMQLRRGENGIAAFLNRSTAVSPLDQLPTFSGRSGNGPSCCNLPFASCKAAGQQRANFWS